MPGVNIITDPELSFNQLRISSLPGGNPGLNLFVMQEILHLKFKAILQTYKENACNGIVVEEVVGVAAYDPLGPVDCTIVINIVILHTLLNAPGNHQSVVAAFQRNHRP